MQLSSISRKLKYTTNLGPKSSHSLYGDYIQKSAVIELLGNCSGKRILEIGSGTGRFTKELVKHGASVVCVDLSCPMHEQSRSSLKGGSVQYFVMSGLDLAFEDESFDACLTVNMMSHIRNDKAIFSQVRRVLKKDGLFVANFPNIGSIYFPVGGFVNLFGRSVQVPVYSRWYSIGKVVRSLRNSGLMPVNILGRMIFPKKYCPTPVFVCLKAINSQLSSSNVRFLAGDLFVQSIKRDVRDC